MTIRQAINNLVAEGYLYRHTGRGTFVSETRIEHSTYKLMGFTEEMLHLSKKPENEVLEFKIKKCDEYLAKKMEIEKGAMIYEVVRLRSIEGEPVILEETYMPVEIFPDLSIQIMAGSKYEYIEKVKKLKIKESIQEIIPSIADEKISKLLKMDEGEPILKFKSASRLQDNRVFEYTELYFKTSRYKFIQKSTR
jgi:GntR family mannosyl-D-glycerate transport/metabolism transcriptional repressor